MKFTDLIPNYPPMPWSITQDFAFEGDRKPRIEMSRIEIRAKDHRLIASDRKIASVRTEQMQLFELLHAAPAMLDLLVKLYKAGSIAGSDATWVEELIAKHFTSKTVTI